jgi:regulatory protein
MDGSERSTITAIEAQVKNRERVSIFVDGEFALGMHAEVAAQAGLRVGDAASVAELEKLARAEELRRVRESALSYLGYRARSRAEIQRRLAQKGYDPELIQEALEALARSGLVNDAEFSQAWVRARTASRSRPLGPNRIAAELRQKGVERELIEEALQPVDPAAELDLALRVGRQKVEQLRGEDRPTARRKLGAALMRRGFGWEVCSRALDILLTDEELGDQ